MQDQDQNEDTRQLIATTEEFRADVMAMLRTLRREVLKNQDRVKRLEETITLQGVHLWLLTLTCTVGLLAFVVYLLTH